MSTERDLASAGIGLAAAERVRPSALRLFCVGGNRVLPAPARELLRDILDRGADFVPVVKRIIGGVGPSTGCSAQAGVAAARTLAGGIALGSVVGGVVDGALAAREARNSGLPPRVAAVAVARGVGEGALVAAAGSGAAVALVALLGPVGPAGVGLAALAGTLSARAALTRSRA